MGKKIIAIYLTLVSIGSFAQIQNDSSFVQPGLMKAFGCFAFDYRTNQATWDYRIHGFLEYYMDKKISVMGEVYHYLDSNKEFPIINRNFSVGTGMGYHWSKKRVNPYIFIMAIGNFYESQIKNDSGMVVRDKMSPNTGNPGVAVGGGINLYVWKYFHFFAQMRYHHTFIYSSIQIANIDAFSVSYGLGLNLQTKKKYKK